MTDPYALSDSSAATTARDTTPAVTPPRPATSPTGTSPSAAAPARRSTTVWWVVLALALVANLLSSAGVVPLAVGIGSGVVTLVCVAALVLARVRRR